MTMPSPLPALPGSDVTAGSGPAEAATLDRLLDDAAPTAAVPIGVALAGHLDLLDDEHGDLLGPLIVPAPLVPALQEAAPGGLTAVRILLAAGSDDDGPDGAGSDGAGSDGAGSAALRRARAALFDDDRFELLGVRVVVPAGDPATATRQLLADLDLSVPAWIAVPPGPTAAAALDVLVADGAENACVDLSAGTDAELADLIRGLVDRDLSFRAGFAAGVLRGRTPGVLNVLCAVRAALNGAGSAELAAILAESRPEPLASAVRRMSDADAAVCRAFLSAIELADVGAALAELHRLGLLPG
jgi:hypothetical protein